MESIQEFRQDAAFALRGFRRAPLFTAVALLTIANRRRRQGDERRRYYRLTPFGRRVVAAEAARLRALVRLAESARLLSPERA